MNASERSLKAMKALRAQNDELLAQVDSLVQERDGLLRALEFIRDCEHDDDEGVRITVSFLKEQARSAIYQAKGGA